MKTAAISFTSMLMAVYAETLDLSTVDEFYVGCDSRHLPHPSSALLPFELGWCREVGTNMTDMDYSEHLQPRDRFSPKQVSAYTRLWEALYTHPVYRHDANIWDVCHHLLDNGFDRVWVQYKWEDKTTQAEERHGEVTTPVLARVKIGV